MADDNGNGNGHRFHEVKREVEYQEKIAEVEHQQLRSASEKLEEKHESTTKHIYSKIDDNTQAIHSTINAFSKAMDSKHKFVLTIVVTMLGVTLTMSLSGDQALDSDIYRESQHLESRIHEVELQMFETRDVVMQNDRLLDAIVSGDVLLSSEIEQDGRLLEIINEMNSNKGGS